MSNRRRRIVVSEDDDSVMSHEMMQVTDHLGGDHRVLIPAHAHTVCSPDDALSNLDELVESSHYTQSSLSNLAAWAGVREYQNAKQTLSQLDGDLD